MKHLKETLRHLFWRTTVVKKLCFLSAMLGYKYTSDWIINNVPEAAYLINDHFKKYKGSKEEMIQNMFKDADYIFDKAENKLKQVDMLEKNGFDESYEVQVLRKVK